MASRRMFSKTIVGSARFLKMPTSSRLLYFDLGVRADDEGVAESWSVMRETGAAEDDLRVLITKGFVVLLNDDLVTYIMDWDKNNFIRRDRYTPSEYHSLLVKFNLVSERNDDLYEARLTDGQPAVNLGKDSIGKDRLDKVSVGKDKEEDMQGETNDTSIDDRCMNYAKPPSDWEARKQAAMDAMARLGMVTE